MAGWKSGGRWLAVVLVLAVSAPTATAYQVPVAPFGQGDTATATMPGSRLTQTIAVRGATELLDATTAGVRGTTATTYAPAIARTTPAQDLVVNTGTCAATGSCGDRGTVTITFSQPVRDPVLHLAGIGGAATRTVNGRPSAQSELHSVLKLATAGLSLRKVGQGNNLAVTSDTITAANPDAGPNCVNTDTGGGPEASATAACGSVQVNGVVTSVAFDVTAVFTKNPKLPAFNTPTSGDVFSIVASTGEDFGDAPASYGAAWSVLSDVRLGAEATADNAEVANATAGPAMPDAGDDGATFEHLLVTAKSYSVPVTLSGASKPGRVCGWIDLDGDGKFQPAERSCATFAAGQSAATLNWSDFPRPKPGTTSARVRVGYTAAQVESPTGAADAGEVEDHLVVIAPPPPPVAADDQATTPFDTGVSTDVLGNDRAGDPSTPLRPASLCLVAGDTCKQWIAVAGQGKYVAKPDGRIDFDPVPGFVGRGKPVTYRVADSNGATATALYTVTVALPDKPVATPDTATTAQNVSLTLRPLTNDKPAAGVTFDPRSLVLRDPADAKFKPKVTIPAEGTYTVKPAGVVDFVPLPRFTGVATTIGYRVTDSTKQTAESTLLVTVTAVTPKALGDSVGTPFDTAVVASVLDNDLPGSADAPLNPATLRLVDPATGNPADKVTVSREGNYQVLDGKVTFSPVSGFQGSTTALTYQVLDKNGTPARAELVVSVAAPGPPVANPDTVTTPQGRPISVPVLDNDKPGPTGSTLVPGSVRLVPPTRGTPGTSLVVPGQGRYAAMPDGRIRFDPVPTFHGKATAVAYQVADGNGSVGRSMLTVEVDRVQPDATDDTAATEYDKTITVSVLANDTSGDPAVPLVPSSVRLIDPVGGGAKSVVTVAGQATYKAQADGTVEVDPLPSFTGVGTALTYSVTDVNGTTARATLTVTIAKPSPPTAEPDEVSTKQGVPVTLQPLANDTAGRGTALDPASLVLVDPADGSPKKLVTVAGQGRYQVMPDGRVWFAPGPAFTGAATRIGYRVADRFGQPARSTLAITVAAVQPVAVDDNTTTPYDTVATVKVLANDKAGDASAPLVPAGLVLKDPADGAFKTAVTLPKEGTFTVRAGTVVFDPLPSFTGSATELTYRVADRNGTTTTAVLRITVGAPPIARPDTASTRQDVTVSVNVLSNDSPGTDAKLDAATVVLRSAVLRGGDWGKTLTVPGQGTYTVQPTGMIVFDPVPAFRGKAHPVKYQVTDSHRSTASSTLAVTVVAIDPFTVDDSGITPFNRPITVNVLANDEPGDPSAPLVPASLLLKDPADGGYRKQVTQPKEGTYVVGEGGAITFSPAKDYQGVTTPATYRVADDNGTTAEGLLFLTVGKGPQAKPDTATTKQNVKVTVDPLGNDVPGTDAQLEKASVRMFGTDRAWGRRVTVAGQGTFEVDEVTGKITFTPVRSYSGPSSVSYQVRDTSGNEAAATLTVTVDAIVPTPVNDAATTAYDSALTVDVLANDKPGDPTAPLVPGSVRLVDAATGDPVPSVQVAGQGTYTAQPDGGVRFAPVPGWTGAATPVSYQVADRNGTTATAMLTMTVGARPVARPDVVETKQARSVTIDPLTNDRAGAGASLDPASVLLVDPRGDLVDRLTVPGQGAYVVAGGKLTVTPDRRFTGSATPVRYEVKDTNRNAARSTVSVTVVPVRPMAADDEARTAYGVPVVLRVLANDKAGDPSAPLTVTSVLLRDPVDSKEKTAVTVAGEGTFTAKPDGTVAFAPAKGFTGTTRAITYRITDANGTSDTARMEVTVDGPLGAKAAADRGTGTPDNPVVVNPLLNDAPTDGAEWDRASVCLRTDSATCAKRVEVAGTGVWTVGTAGTIQLVPAPGFRGTAKQLYRVADTNGVTVESHVKVTVGARPAPAITPVAASGPLPDTGGPPVMLLTLGTLLAALGVTLLTVAYRSRRQ
ncbi:CshA-type fibril repeat protein [Kribbella amoyensis]|uniref:CshA-type fibril repeat protein n=1 Tax=Kribbella amoyensis TaxID=996641 RepID=A0A561B2Z0_9ACTN|nr:Ig-like domain-containing protein [Kribbella amoyensis]TWD73204.1 CshA-type fibril repeat protein [Kribbella amoyensis]